MITQIFMKLITAVHD